MVDATGGLWASGALAGKGFSLFTPTETQSGGAETIILPSLPPFVHHSMVYIPPGYAFGKDLFSNAKARNRSPWRVSLITGSDSLRQPSQLELDIAGHQGKYVAEKVVELAT